MSNFYLRFLNWLKKDDELGIIIKSKKPDNLKSLSDLRIIFDKSLKTKRCYIVEDPFQKIPSYYSKICNFSIGLSTWIPSALIECVVNNSKGIFLDYPNIKKFEIDFFKNNNDEIIFSDLDNMINKLKLYKKNPHDNKKLGSWDKIINDLDPYRDGRGAERIGFFIKILSQGFDKKLDINENIKNAKLEFSKLFNKT